MDILNYFFILAAIAFVVIFMTYVFIRVFRFTRGCAAPVNEQKMDEEKIRHTTGLMTGRTRLSTKGSTKTGYVQYTEYELVYSIAGIEYHKWFDLYPGPDRGDIFPQGTEVFLSYDYENPEIFEVVEIMEPF